MKTRKIMPILLLLLVTTAGNAAERQEDKKTAEAVSPTTEISLLAPVKTESPRDTMRSYYQAMSHYVSGKRSKDPRADSYLQDAIRTLDLSGIPAINQSETAKETVILLKEVLDRVIVLDYGKIPGESDEFISSNSRWRLKGTEIIISRIAEGERKDEWLFSSQTVPRVRDFYEKVKHLPYLADTTAGAAYREPWQNERLPLPEWMRGKLLGLLVWQWLGILAAILLGFVIRAVFAGIGAAVLNLSRKTKTVWDEKLVEALISPCAFLAATGIWMFSLKYLGIRGGALTALNIILQIMLSVSLIWIFYRTVGVLTEYIRIRSNRSGSRLDEQIVKLISSSLKTFIVVFGVLLAAQNMGVEIFSVLAGLGIGGLAIAMAAKDTLANFFGSILIMWDKPFQVGHWVIIGDIEGTVEEIGFRTTRIRTFYNSLVSVPNSNIATTGIDNLGLREFRRVKTHIDITYDTSPEKIEQFVQGIKVIIQRHPNTRKDYFHVVFNDFSESSLRLLLYFFLEVPDWSTELADRQQIFLDIVRLANELNVAFAFPTRTVHLESSLPGA